MKRRLPLLIALLLAAAGPAGAADFSVGADRPFKPSDHLASGALYGIAAPGWPPQSWIDAIHPKNFTEMAPGGHQLPNGETRPVGDALIVAPLAAAAGASVTIRLPDTFASFPYLWPGRPQWDAEVQRIVAATRTANPPNIYAYEVWNEPDWTWQGQWGDFNAIWAETVDTIRTADPKRRIMGPSLSRWDIGRMHDFLAAAKTTRTVPDIVSWHELDPRDEDDVEAHVTAYRGLEKTLGLPPHPISINEYGSQRAMATPAALLHYIAQFERAGVDTADLAFWHRPGRLGDLLVPKTLGTGPATDPAPNGAYWLYRWYGDMRGKMVSATATPGSGLDGVAAVDVASRQLTLLVGGRAGQHTVDAIGLSSFGPAVSVDAMATDWTGTDGILAAPQPLFHGTLAVGNGTVSIPLTLTGDTEVADIEIGALPPDEPPSPLGLIAAPLPGTQTIEAERGSVTGGRKFTIRPQDFAANRASGDAYVGFFNRARASLTLPIEVPAAGRYALALGYSNGLARPQSLTLAVDGGPAGTLNLPPTQGRELFGLTHTTLALPAGSSTLTLDRASPPAAVAAGPSVLELDRIELTALP